MVLDKPGAPQEVVARVLVSHHLKVLSEAGLVVGDKRGRWIWYRVLPERLAQLRTALA